jgi:GNAT superfamily N-acetyltransferase
MTTASVRIATQDDLRFILSSWFESYLKQRNYPFDDFDIYKAGMNARQARVLARADVHVAFYETVPDEILGYAIVEGDALHWVYTALAYRKAGVASGLLGKGLRRYATIPAKKWTRDWLRARGMEQDPSLLEVR